MKRSIFLASSRINCFPISRYVTQLRSTLLDWSCCAMSLQGSCLSIMPPPNASAPIYATCNMSHVEAPYVASCLPGDENPACVWPPDMGLADPRLATLCALICGGCQ